MAREEYRVDLTADNEISDAARQAAKDLDKLPDKVEVEITANSRLVERSIDDVLGKVDKLTGDAANLLLTSNAEAITREIADLVTEVDQLDAADPTIDIKAGQIDKLQGDLDALSTKAKEINNTPVTLDTKPAVDGIKDIGGAADGSQSALANMVGNSAQDIGELAGISGTAGVALGQVAEGAADGNVSLGNLAKTAGPMAALAIITKGISDHFAEIAATKAFDAAQVREFADALGDGATSAEALADALTETGKLEFRLDALDQTVDLVPILRELGLTVSDFDRIMRSGEPGIKAWGDAAKAAGADADAVNGVMIGATEIGRNYAAGQEALADTTAVLGDEFADTADAASDFAAEELTLREQLEGTAAAARDAIAAQQEMADARRGAADATFAVRDAQRDFDDQLAKFAEQTSPDSDAALQDLAETMDDTARSAGRVADSQVELARKQSEAKGTTLSASQAQQTWNRSMLTSARTADGPLRDSIIAYIAEVNGIPPEKVSEILANPDYASLDAAAGALDDVAHPRSSDIVADAITGGAEGALNYTARTRYADIVARAVIGGAAGAIAGLTRVGATATAAPAGAMAMSAEGELLGAPAPATTYAAPMALTPTQVIVQAPRLPTPNITITAGVIGNRFDVERTVAHSLRRWERRNGRRRP